jgi:hypothetical protein
LNTFYAGNALCSAGGVHGFTESANYALLADSALNTDQNNWRWCSKCQSLAFSDGTRLSGLCPGGGRHDHSASCNYTVAHDLSAAGWQAGWRHCTQCETLAYSGNYFPGACPAGGVHALGQGSNYDLPFDPNRLIIDPSDHNAFVQDGWRWCYKCEALVFAGNYRCPAGGLHDPSVSDDYSIPFTGVGAAGQSGWKWCSKCQGLFYGADGRTGYCIAGNGHDGSASGDYTLIQNATPALEEINWWHCSQCECLFNWDGTGQPGPCPALPSGQVHTNAGRLELQPRAFRRRASVPRIPAGAGDVVAARRHIF